MSSIDTYELNYLRNLANAQKSDELQDDQLFCECNCVSVGELRSFCADKSTISFQEKFKLIQENLKVGTACGSCIKTPNDIEKIIESKK